DAEAGDASVREKAATGIDSIGLHAAAEDDAPQNNSDDGNGARYTDASPISHGGNLQVTKDTSTGKQLRRRLPDGTALRGTSGRVVKQEMPAGAVADGAGEVDTSGNVRDISMHDLFGSAVGNKAQNGQSGDGSELIQTAKGETTTGLATDVSAHAASLPPTVAAAASGA
ncbi:hypothetical protein CNYM01_14289, partial [Colletotrichum nymphaeae SA-01]